MNNSRSWPWIFYGLEQALLQYSKQRCSRLTPATFSLCGLGQDSKQELKWGKSHALLIWHNQRQVQMRRGLKKCVFNCEILKTQQISWYYEDDKDDDSLH